MRFREMLFTALYNYVSRVDRDGEITLMNFGYLGEGDVDALGRVDVDCSENLYLRAAGGADLAGRSVLEVGCGRGGGLAYLHRTLRPAQSHGIDPAEAAIQFCSSHHRQDGLSFSAGKAEELAFADASFDAVLNVESSHRYQGMAAFVAHAFRVLKPGGLMLITDFRYDHEMTETRALFPAAGFEIVARDDITAEVVRALDHDHERRRALVRKHVPWPLRRIALNFAGAPGSETYREFHSREYIYFSDAYRKPG
jgi:2-polyprenyl-3-methyl-5-hydroxy-6-metoxy-1,4-benzoquinol methylase